MAKIVRPPMDRDPIQPKHYKASIKGVECDILDIIEGLGLNFHLGNVLKYIYREKENPLEDLRKAREYLDREIKRREAAQ